ncbi:hypothetical protein NDU88_001065 [Pleurodeles waltl]|uniref:Uncharacterized protein n=1 Tax=Pleurodeles waltl TaxID=8319 RepID=A0AAV7MKR4_PLEWA|nr:hypothetical protein NDU88_001065 [Pleurodeles waltl]
MKLACCLNLLVRGAACKVLEVLSNISCGAGWQIRSLWQRFIFGESDSKETRRLSLLAVTALRSIAAVQFSVVPAWVSAGELLRCVVAAQLGAAEQESCCGVWRQPSSVQRNRRAAAASSGNPASLCGSTLVPGARRLRSV